MIIIIIDQLIANLAVTVQCKNRTLHSCKSLQFCPLLPVHAVVVALAVRLDCNHRYHHNNGEERGRLKCIIKLQREEVELVSRRSACVEDFGSRGESKGVEGDC